MVRKYDKLLITNASILQNDQFVDGERLLLESGRIRGSVSAKKQSASLRQIDATGLLVIPGLIDLHLHVGLIPEGEDAVAYFSHLARIHSSFGTTRFLGSFGAASLHALKEKVLKFRSWAPQSDGARPIGLLFEGPFLNPQKAGAQAKEHIIGITPDAVKDFLSIIGDEKCVVALAPEIDGAISFVRELKGRNIIVALGHTDADYKEAMKALDAGAHYAIHLFNQMRPLHHRDPGVVGALLEDREAVVEIIADGTHLDPTVVHLVWRLKGEKRIVLASDSVQFPSEDIQAPPRLATGTLAGGSLSLLQCTLKCKDCCHITFAEALRMATLTPAELLGVEKDFGSIAPGKIADLVLLTPDGRVMMTIVDGQIVYDRAQKKRNGYR